MGIPWEDHGNIHPNIVGASWEDHGNIMGTSGKSHKNIIMGVSWEFHASCLV